MDTRILEDTLVDSSKQELAADALMLVVLVVVDPESSCYFQDMEYTLLKVVRQQPWDERNAEEVVVVEEALAAVHEFLLYHSEPYVSLAPFVAAGVEVEEEVEEHTVVVYYLDEAWLLEADVFDQLEVTESEEHDCRNFGIAC